jgi:hypothetical protein
MSISTNVAVAELSSDSNSPDEVLPKRTGFEVTGKFFSENKRIYFQVTTNPSTCIPGKKILLAADCKCRTSDKTVTTIRFNSPVSVSFKLHHHNGQMIEFNYLKV